MKIISFNVNGIRAILKKNFIEDFNKLNADIFVIEETKFSSDDFIFKPNNYYLYFTNSKIRKGYSGVAIYTKIKPINVYYGLEKNEYDEEGRIITLEYDKFYLVGAYVPNSGDGLKRLNFRMEFEDKIKKYLLKLDSKKPVIYTGDLNVAHEEIDIKNPSINRNNAGFTDQERNKMTELLKCGFVDVFRHLYKNTIKYSWWSYRFNARANNIGWRIDYFIVSKKLMNNIKDCKIHDEIYGSDHCPISLSVDV